MSRYTVESDPGKNDDSGITGPEEKALEKERGNPQIVPLNFIEVCFTPLSPSLV